MKILIVSDTHDSMRWFDVAFLKERPIDMLIHCGDIGRDEDYLRCISGCPTYIVGGNNDWGNFWDRDLELMIGKYKVFITHGHRYGVWRDNFEELAQEGIRRQADIVMFGHIHCPVIEEREDITILNPGSLSQPRQKGFCPTYIIMEIDGNGEAHYTLHELS